MYIDLTHMIDEGMPVYPGTEEPVLDRTYNIEDYGFRETRLKMFSHTGTHIDAPSHMLKDGKMLESYDVNYFIGKAYILDIRSHVPCLEEIKSLSSKLEDVNYVIIRTGWSEKWGSNDYYNDFPILDVSSTKALLDLGIRGFGIDAISVDKVGSEDFENHMEIFNRQGIIIENLKNLDKIESEFFELIAMPLKLKNSDGISARVLGRTIY